MGLDDKNRPLYMISIAAELAGVHPQTLRSYEQKGLVTPRRTSGNTRMYSQADIDRLNLINELTSEGINLAARKKWKTCTRGCAASPIAFANWKPAPPSAPSSA